MVNDHRDFVANTLQGGGVPQADLDDEVQRTFIVAARRLEQVQLGSERAFLYRVARHTALHAARTRTRRREIAIDDFPDMTRDTGVFASPESLTQRRQMWTLLTGVLDRMYEPWREAFVLYDLEGMHRSEIAALLKCPDGTVASRIRMARNQIKTLLARELAP